MRLRPPAFRTAAAAITAFHLLAAVLWPIVDARLEAAEQVATAHVESERSTPCTPGHDDFFCQVCRSISVAGDEAISSVTLVAGIARTVPVSARTTPSPQRAIHCPHAPRAPPLS